jgi:hypothetical protein
LIIWGYVYDKNGYRIGNVTVTLKNIDTNESKKNETPVTSTDGYQFNLANFDLGWNPGNVLHIESRYQEGGHNYSDGYTFPIPLTINTSGYTMNRPLNLNNCEDCTGDGDTPGQQKPVNYIISGTVIKQNSEVAEKAVVIVTNCRTMNSTGTSTDENGMYRTDLLYHGSAWKYGDDILINVTHGTGNLQQTGYYAFKILHSLKNERVVNIRLYLTFDQQTQPPANNTTYQGKTIQEWIDNCQELQTQYNLSIITVEELQQNITLLKDQLNNTDTNHSQDEWNKLTWEVDQLRRENSDNKNILIVIAIVFAMCIIYILWRNDIIPLPIFGRYSTGRKK